VATLKAWLVVLDVPSNQKSDCHYRKEKEQPGHSRILKYFEQTLAVLADQVIFT
jgi:hypothetical protein